MYFSARGTHKILMTFGCRTCSLIACSLRTFLLETFEQKRFYRRNPTEAFLQKNFYRRIPT